MKKILVVFAAAGFLSVNFANASNILLENQKYKKELDLITAKQKQENAKQILYYKGKPDYAGLPTVSSKSSNNGKGYEKKGVRFKVDKNSVEAEKNKEETVKEQNTVKTEAETPSAEPQKTTETKPAQAEHHNEDAE